MGMPEGNYTEKLFKLLDENRVKRGEKTSHYSMGTPVGNYYLSGTKRDRLNRLVSRALEEGTILHILETHRNQGPIIFDIDLKYDSTNNDRKYNKYHIIKTVEVYNNIISKYFDLTDNSLFCFITLLVESYFKSM